MAEQQIGRSIRSRTDLRSKGNIFKIVQQLEKGACAPEQIEQQVVGKNLGGNSAVIDQPVAIAPAGEGDITQNILPAVYFTSDESDNSQDEMPAEINVLDAQGVANLITEMENRRQRRVSPNDIPIFGGGKNLE